MNKLFTPLSEYDISNLTNDWVFTSLIDFIDNVQRGGLIDYDGFGEFIFVDKQGQLYLKESAHFYPSEIMSTIKEIKKDSRLYTNHDVATEIRKKYQENGFTPFAVFWYNK